jgi:hypothetical protein
MNLREKIAEPKIGERRTSSCGTEMVWMIDPWSWLTSFPAWCSIHELEKDGFEPPNAPPPTVR